MKLNDLRKKNEPHWARDTSRKVYVVYDKDGNVVSEHPYEQEWNANPAYRAAVDAVGQLKTDEYNKQKHYNDFERPLNEFEKEYMELDRKVRNYLKQLKSPEVDEKTKDVYGNQVDKWLNRLEQLVRPPSVVRQSVIHKTHKALKA